MTRCGVRKKNGSPCKLKTAGGYPCMWHETDDTIRQWKIRNNIELSPCEEVDAIYDMENE